MSKIYDLKKILMNFKLIGTHGVIDTRTDPPVHTGAKTRKKKKK